MGALQRGDDALVPCEPHERPQRLLVGRRGVLGATNLLQVGVFGPDAGVVQPR